jgi:hypothetical protein
MRDEINEMFPERKEARQIMENTFLLAEFLKERTDYDPPRLRMGAVVHGHCHHKSIIKGVEHEQELFEKMGMDMRILSDGCCGMAGSFGYEEGKYDISKTISEHALAPAVRHAGLRDIIVADGFSCREQILQFTDRHALHTAEVLQLALHQGPGGPDGMRPEERFVREHAQAVRRSKLEALAAVGASGAAHWPGQRLSAAAGCSKLLALRWVSEAVNLSFAVVRGRYS